LGNGSLPLEPDFVGAASVVVLVVLVAVVVSADGPGCGPDFET